jgi:hypothetical protein
MPGTLSDSWKLTTTSFRLIADDRALLVFPVVAGLAILGVLSLFLLGALWLLPFVLPGGGTATPYEILGVVLFLAAYFVISFVSVFASAALVGAATLKLNGQQPSAADGWRIARSRLGRLSVWALITATVGLVIQLISSRTQGIGGAVIGIVGGATWGVTTYFMIPVLIFEDQGAWKSLTRSTHLFVSTFGRSLITNFVVGLMIGAGIVAAVVLGIVGLFTFIGGSPVLGVILLIAAVGVAVVVALFGAAAEGVLRAALYRYATTGRIDPDFLPGAYRRPRGRPATAPLP